MKTVLKRMSFIFIAMLMLVTGFSLTACSEQTA